MGNAARDLRYGRRGGAWADGWSDADEERYQAQLAEHRAAQAAPTEAAATPALFDLEGGDQ